MYIVDLGGLMDQEECAVQKRRFPRTALKGRVGVLVDTEFTFAEGHTIGEGGMLIRHSSGLKQGATIEAHFCLNDDSIIDAKAQILYVIPDDKDKNQRYFGLKFIEISAKDRHAIACYVKKIAIP